MLEGLLLVVPTSSHSWCLTFYTYFIVFYCKLILVGTLSTGILWDLVEDIPKRIYTASCLTPGSTTNQSLTQIINLGTKYIKNWRLFHHPQFRTKMISLTFLQYVWKGVLKYFISSIFTDWRYLLKYMEWLEREVCI